MFHYVTNALYMLYAGEILLNKHILLSSVVILRIIKIQNSMNFLAIKNIPVIDTGF